MTSQAISVVIVEDHQITLDGLKSAFERSDEFSVVGCAENSDDGLELVKRTKPQVVLLDLHLPGSMGPRTCVESFCQLKCSKIVILSGESGAAFVQSVQTAGVSGYLLKSERPVNILEAVKRAARGDVGILSKALICQTHQLTAAEQVILELLAVGKKYQEIADERGTAPETIRRQCETLLSKLHLNNREELIAWAATNGFNRLN